jgi:SAM-dependent methyltransferase
MTRACAVCGSREANVSPLRADLVECRSCGLIYNPDAREDRGEFGERYYVEGVYADYVADRDAVRRSAASRLRALERIAPGRRLLDVGCAAGYFMEAARSRGWEVSGLELSGYAGARARAAELDVHEASILDPPALAPFDAITLWDTIEHISDPALAVRNARRMLRPGGVLAISTGDRRSAVARALGPRWRLLGDPTHKFFFDQPTLQRLLMNEQFRIVAAGRPGKWVSSSMVLHQAGVPGAAALRRWLAKRHWNPALYVNLWDVMTVVATRPS